MTTGMEPGAALVVDAAVQMFARAAKSPLEKLLFRVAGRKLLILGPTNTGKTSLAEFLRFGITADGHGQHQPSEEEEVQKAFFVETTDGHRISARFRSAKTLPGQLWPRTHAKEIKNNKPALSIVILDVAKFNGRTEGCNQAIEVKWFEDFSNALVHEYNRSSEKVRSNLKILVILNKIDKVNPTIVVEMQKEIQKILKNILTLHLSPHCKYYKILPCCLLDKPEFAPARNRVIRRILAELQ